MSEFPSPWHDLPLEKWEDLENHIRTTEEKIRKARELGDNVFLEKMEMDLPALYCRGKPKMAPRFEFPR